VRQRERAKDLAGFARIVLGIVLRSTFRCGFAHPRAKSHQHVVKGEEDTGCNPDDLTVAELADPPLTTLRTRFDELGQRAESLLLDEIAGLGVRAPRIA
jgi:hypothetical protein